MKITEKIENLAKAYIGEEQKLDLISEDLRNIGEFVFAASKRGYHAPFVKEMYEGNELNNKISEFDREVLMRFEKAAYSLKRLNEFSEERGLPKFYDGEFNDDIAVFCGDYVKEMFKEGTKTAK